jgi:hypothetical protein
MLGAGSSRRYIEALSPEGGVYVTETYQENGKTLLWRDHPARHLTLGIDHRPTNWPKFSPDGKLLAVGTAEGTVLVYDLERIDRSLDNLRLGFQ